ncbi:MAG TPA: diacylglycerol kinase [Gallionellaceae bacterium]
MKNRPFLQRLRFALDGIYAAWRAEPSFRVQTLCMAALIALLVWLRPAPLWWAILLTVTGLVLAAELINTALERVIDHLHPEQHPMMKVAKDCAAGAVLVTALTAVAVFIAFLAEALPGSWAA